MECIRLSDTDIILGEERVKLHNPIDPYQVDLIATIKQLTYAVNDQQQQINVLNSRLGALEARTFWQYFADWVSSIARKAQRVVFKEN